jgi:hypothetical protein
MRRGSRCSCRQEHAPSTTSADGLALERIILPSLWRRVWRLIPVYDYFWPKDHQPTYHREWASGADSGIALKTGLLQHLECSLVISSIMFSVFAPLVLSGDVPAACADAFSARRYDHIEFWLGVSGITYVTTSISHILCKPLPRAHSVRA